MRIKLYDVQPSIPEKLSFLEELARNMWWCWNGDAEDLFQRIDAYQWYKCKKNAVVFLDRVPQNRFNELAKDKPFLDQLQKVHDRFRKEVFHGGSNIDTHGRRDTAYFCLEYGIHESIRLYSGGLGVLAGDHLKAASDVNAPFIGVGLLYRQGYFEQYLNQEGWQQEHYTENVLHELPLRAARDSDGKTIKVRLPLPGGKVEAVVWTIWMGNIPLYLLDTNIPENKPEYRGLTGRLYGGDDKMRLSQELLLAVGGFRALITMGYEPAVCHMNEGHAAFLSLARIEYLMKQKNFGYEKSLEVVRRSNVFTTHTPVAAGNEYFSVDLVRPYLEALKTEMNIDPEEVLRWGMPYNEKKGEICNTILALRMSHCNNAVSRLHGRVARDMWAHLWKERPRDEVPIGCVTNAVHATSWVGEEQQTLFDRYLGPHWRKEPYEVAESVENIPEEELWRAHEYARTRLIRAARDRMEKQSRARNATESEISKGKNVLQDDVLTVGFARRFTTYKRATLLLHDPERFRNLLTNHKYPIQFIFAGKAHPADEGGKDMIRQLIAFNRNEEIGRRLVFLEDYDIALARQMVQGVDVWLNTPRRPLEASGTSGMKACMNGALHLSVLDGWWAEAYDSTYGWAIGDGRVFEDVFHQDMVESHALFNLLEKEVAPLYYNRGQNTVPEQWLKKCKASICQSLKHYTTHRMFAEYNKKYYTAARNAYRELTENGGKKAQDYIDQRKRFEQYWDQISLPEPQTDRDISSLKTGESFEVSVEARLGELKPEEVEVQVYYGPVDAYQNIRESHYKIMDQDGALESGGYRYRQRLHCEDTGRYGFTCRVVPAGEDWTKDMPGFVTWA